MTYAPTRRRRLVALAISVAAITATFVPAASVPAVAQAALPTVTAAALDGGVITLHPCEGEDVVRTNVAILKVERTGDTTDALTVHVTYSGTIDPSLPTDIVIPAGEAAGFVSFESTEPGSVTLTIDADAAYTPGEPSAATVAVRPTRFDALCETAAQTIELGATPMSLDLEGRFGSAVGDTSFEMEGDVPPGLTFRRDGSFTGAATQLGTYRFTVRYTLGDGFAAAAIDVTITVVAPQLVDPTVTAPPPGAPSADPPSASPARPATPLPGSATFTG